MKRVLLWMLLLVPLAAAAAPVVYRWVDSHGVVHYSDQPHPGAVKVTLGALSTVNFHAPQVSAESPAPAAGTAATAASYQVKILAPADGTTLRPANWEVHADVTVTPPLGRNTTLEYQLDGKALGPSTQRTSITLQKVYRGTHTLTVSVLGPGGAKEGQASSTFYIHHPSLQFKNRPPRRH